MMLPPLSLPSLQSFWTCFLKMKMMMTTVPSWQRAQIHALTSCRRAHQLLRSCQRPRNKKAIFNGQKIEQMKKAVRLTVMILTGTSLLFSQCMPLLQKDKSIRSTSTLLDETSHALLALITNNSKQSIEFHIHHETCRTEEFMPS